MSHLKHKDEQDLLLQTRYFKEFWGSAKEYLKIKSIKFGVFSEIDIDQLSSKQITSPSIYNPEIKQWKLYMADNRFKNN